jgi:hypothetical protein
MDGINNRGEKNANRESSALFHPDICKLEPIPIRWGTDQIRFQILDRTNLPLNTEAATSNNPIFRSIWPTIKS